MPITLETLDEANHRLGNNFTYFYAGNGLAPDQEIFLAFCVGDKDVVLTSIDFTGSVELITWTWYQGSQLDTSSGTPVIEIPLNVRKLSSSGTKLLLVLITDITDIGTPVIPGAIDSIGVVAADSRAKLEDRILTKNMTILKNTNHIIKIKTRQSSGGRNLNVKVNFFKVEN